MKKLNTTEELINLMSVQSTSGGEKRMQKFIKDYLKSIGNIEFWQDKGNIYAIKGVSKSYPCVVAHTDTVHSIIDDFRVLLSGDEMIAIDGKDCSRAGIGGDDKVGIFVALQAMKRLDVCKAAFFREEEIGCKGSAQANMDFFSDTEFVIQCDRQGMEGVVDSIYGIELYDSNFSKKINDILLKYNRKEIDGGLTDVYQLAENGLDVCCMNVCCGYYRPHTDDEFIVVSHVMSTINMVLEIIDRCKGERHTIIRSKKQIMGYGRSYFDGWDDWNYKPYNGRLSRHEVSNISKGLDGILCPDCGFAALSVDEVSSTKDEIVCTCDNCFGYFAGTDLLAYYMDEDKIDVPVKKVKK